MINKNLKSKSSIYYLSYLFICIPVFLISGPFLTEISISVLAIASFFYVREKKYYYNYFFVFCILFWIILMLSSILSLSNFLSLKNSLFYFRYCFFCILIWNILNHNIFILKKTLIILLISFALLIFDGSFQYIFGLNIFFMEMIVENRVSSFFGDELKMGSYLMRIFPIIISLLFFFYNKAKHKKYLSLIFLFILLTYTTIYLSGERTSFILFNFIILLFIIFIKGLNFFRIFFSLIFILITFLMVISNNPFKKRLIDFTSEQISNEKFDNKIILFSKQYTEHYHSAWLMFKDNKIIGIGPKNFREICKREKYNFSELTCSTHPHNTMLQLLAETGVLGFAFYFFANLIVWYLLLTSLFSKKLKLSNFQISLLITISVSIFPFSPSGNFFNNWVSAIYYYPVGLLLWSFESSKKIYLKPIKNKHF